MKLQQLRFLREVVRNDYNISAAATALHTAQPGVSSQLHLLEQELGILIFERKGKRLTGLTQPGRAVYTLAERILRDVANIKQVGEEFSSNNSGLLSIGTTHTQARYALPKIVQAFSRQFPGVQLHIHQGNPIQIAEMAVSGAVDIAIATEALDLYDDLVTFPCYEWNRCVIALPGHPILKEQLLSLEAIARYPIITYDYAFAGRSKINKAFESKGLKPNVVLTALDSDVIKTYVELGLGIGLLANMAFDPARDTHLRAMDASHLFEPSATRLAIRKGGYLRSYIYGFIALFAPHLTYEVISAALEPKLS